MQEIITAEGFKVSQQWLNLIHYVQTVMPEGKMWIQFAAGSPLELLEQKPKIRFDKQLPSVITEF